MNRIFIYSELFEEALKARKNSELLLEMIEAMLIAKPNCGDLIPGTGGVRKFRVEDNARNKGKRGGIRVLYIDLPHLEVTHLLYLYDKSEADDLSPQGKKLMKNFVKKLKG